MYRGVWYTGAINEEEGERYADGGYAKNAEKLLPEGLQYLRMAQYLHLVPQTFYRVMWGV